MSAIDHVRELRSYAADLDAMMADSEAAISMRAVCDAHEKQAARIAELEEVLDAWKFEDLFDDAPDESIDADAPDELIHSELRSDIRVQAALIRAQASRIRDLEIALRDARTALAYYREDMQREYATQVSSGRRDYPFGIAAEKNAAFVLGGTTTDVKDPS